MRTIAVFTGNRSEYGLLYPVIQAIRQEPQLRCKLVVAGDHGAPSAFHLGELAQDRMVPDARIPLKRARSLGEMAMGVAAVTQKGVPSLQRLRPQMILAAGDRYETFGFVIAAFYMNIPVAHLFGGDVSMGGHLDDSVRHAITKLSHLHLTSNPESERRLKRLGEESWRIFNVGFPAGDTVSSGDIASPAEISRLLSLRLDRPIIVFTQHPVTIEVDQAVRQIRPSLQALKEFGVQTVVTYPNGDAGSQAMIREIERYKKTPHFRLHRSLGRRRYLGLLNVASVMVGNSSSGLAESVLFKLPCVDVGTRQEGRLRGRNVLRADYDKEEIKAAIRKALFDRSFLKQVRRCRNPYGTGESGRAVAKILAKVPLTPRLLQKRITF